MMQNGRAGTTFSDRIGYKTDNVVEHRVTLNCTV